MRITIIFLLCCLTTALSAQKKSDWQQLFNGKNLKGWHPKIKGYALDDNYGNTFRVQKGKMVVAYDQYPAFDNRFGHLFYEKPFNYYRLRIVYRFKGEQATGGPDWAWRNSGVMLHGQSPQSMGKGQDFPISLEAQFLGGRPEGERSTGNLCTPGTHVEMNGKLVTEHCINADSKTYPGDQWVTFEAVVLGDSLLEHYINGDKVMTYSHPVIGGGVVDAFDPSVKKDGTAITGGYLSLQGESHPIEFKKVELLNLEGCMDPKAKNYKPWFVKPDNSQCRY